MYCFSNLQSKICNQQSNTPRLQIHKIIRFFALFLLSTAVLWLGYRADRSHFPELLGGYSLAFLAYFYLTFTKNLPGMLWVAGLGLLLRLLLIFGLPLFSDDVYRFIWDGQLIVKGIHPFAFTPEQLMQQGQGNAALFELLNSPRYFTVYPPVNQAFFYVAARLHPDNLAAAVLTIKTFLLLGEAGTLWVLYRFLSFDSLSIRAVYPKNSSVCALYALNPLVIVETVGNCHFEGMMAGAMLATMLALHRKQPGWAGVWWAVAIAVKLLPVLFTPLILGWLDNWRDRRRFAIVVLTTSVVLFLPLFDLEVILHLGSSMRLYFQKFEFNASVYYLFSHISPWFTGWYEGHIIGVALAEVTLAVVLGLSYRLFYQKEKGIADLQKALFISAFVYLIDATTVHPWYVIVPLAMGVGTRYFFAVVWSWAVVLSYSHYHEGAYQENYGLIFFEYLILGGFVYWNIRQKPATA